MGASHLGWGGSTAAQGQGCSTRGTSPAWSPYPTSLAFRKGLQRMRLSPPFPPTTIPQKEDKKVGGGG